MFNGTIDITPLINIVIRIVALIWVFKLLPLIKSKLSESQFNKLKAATEVVVYAAEKLYGAGHGDEKLNWAIEELRKRGFTADRAIIESYVMKLSMELDWWGTQKGQDLTDFLEGLQEDDEDEFEEEEEDEDDVPLVSDTDHLEDIPRDELKLNTIDDE